MGSGKKIILNRAGGFGAALLLTLLFACGGGGGSASAGACYQGMSLPATFRPFTDDSPWNSPIGDNPALDANSARQIAYLQQNTSTLKGDFTQWTIPLFVIDSTQCAPVGYVSEKLSPLVDPDENGVAENMPIPAEAWPDPERDAHMLLVDPTRMIAWDFSRVVKGEDGSWAGSRADWWDLTGPGYREAFDGRRWWLYGARGSGMPLIAGLIRPEEIAAGEIRHALVFTGPTNRNGLDDPFLLEVCNPPAMRTDGKTSGPDAILMGARLQLDPNLDLDTLGLTEEVKVVARALQEYGMYAGDGGPRVKLFFQNVGADGGVWNNYDFSSLANIPLSSFRITACGRLAQKQVPAN